MKIATTVIEGPKGWMTLEVGENIQEQREAAKEMASANGAGPTRLMVLTSGRSGPMRKSITIKGDAVKAWDEAKASAAKSNKARQAYLAKVAKEKAESDEAIRKAARARSDKINNRRAERSKDVKSAAKKD